MLMCDGAKAEVRKCNGFGNAADMDVVTVLTGGGSSIGVGYGYQGLICPGVLAELAERGLWTTPRDAGLDDQELNLVRAYNIESQACWDVYQDSIGLFTSKDEDEAARAVYEKCLAKAWARYSQDRKDYRNLKK